MSKIKYPPNTGSFFGNRERTAKQGLQTLNPNFPLEKEREQQDKGCKP